LGWKKLIGLLGNSEFLDPSLQRFHALYIDIMQHYHEEEDEDYYGRMYTEEEESRRDNELSENASEQSVGASSSNSSSSSNNASRLKGSEPGRGLEHGAKVRKAQIIIKNAEMGLYEDGDSTHAGRKKRKHAIDSRLNSLIAVLLALQGGPVTIELKNDEVVSGILESVDARMNCTLIGVRKSRPSTCPPLPAPRPSTAKSPSTAAPEAAAQYEQLEDLYVKGGSIRYVLPPTSFRARRDVAAYMEEQEKKSRAPKLYVK